jgi:hypothetical protein
MEQVNRVSNFVRVGSVPKMTRPGLIYVASITMHELVA